MGIVCYFLFLVSRTASSTRISFPCREWSCHGSEVRKVISVVQSAKVLREPIQTTEILRRNFFSALRARINRCYASLFTAFGSGRTTLKLLPTGLKGHGYWSRRMYILLVWIVNRQWP